MSFKHKVVILSISLLLISTPMLKAQNTIDGLHGDRNNRKQGLHNGNLVETLFWNFGEVAWWGKQPSGVWPKGTNHSYMDGIYPLVAAEVQLSDGRITHIVEGGYREHYEEGSTGVEFGWQPLPDFANPDQDYIALSDDPNTWPPYWPDQPADWGGSWNGYFGRKTNADQESYFVMDDYQDYGQDYWGLFNSDSLDPNRGGLGMRVAVRGFQWSNVLAEDIIFWHYDITNVSTTTYPKTVFGMYADAGVGGQNDSNDDLAFYDLSLDLAYTWDSNNLGEGNWETGYAGYAFLESPGNPFDGIDNDEDASAGASPELGSADFQPRNLVDEVVLIDYQNMTVDNNRGRILTSFSAGGSDDFYHFSGDSLFLNQYDSVSVYLRGSSYSEIPFNGVDDDLDGIIDENESVHMGLKFKNFFSGAGLDDPLIDEARDDGVDNDGDWDPELHDVGADGLAGTGDAGEGDGLPTLGEPNFDITDKDESDQIGLTAFDAFYIGQGVEFGHDEVIWDRVANYHFSNVALPGNIAFLFGSGPFIMPPNHTERFSMALVFGENLDDLRRNKEVVQNIYNANYNFARPPEKPTVTAVAGDGKVTLYWDDFAESSYDDPAFTHPATGGYDFEGYRIYKATDASFNDAYNITNGYGEAAFHEPIAQYDYDNDVQGFFNVDVHGIEYYLGGDTGLRHSWVDTDVQNGVTYYYAVVSYDRGWEEKNILPSECTKVIVKNNAGEITVDKNTVFVTPNAPAAGYVSPEIAGGLHRIQGFGTGDININIIDPSLVTDGEYRINFDDTTRQDTLSYTLSQIESNPPDTMIIFSHSEALMNEDVNPLFAGMRIQVSNDTIAPDPENTGWAQGVSNMLIYAERDSYWDGFLGRIEGFPTSYVVQYGVVDSSTLKNSFKHLSNFRVIDKVSGKKVRTYLWEPSEGRDSLLSAGDYLRLQLKVGGLWRDTWRVYFVSPEGDLIMPDSGDVANIGIHLPFRSGDEFAFTSFAADMDQTLAKHQLKNIAVVPNPYVAAAAWESQRMSASGRGERKINFIHLPQQAQISIFNVSGDHVISLDHLSGIDDGALAWNLQTKDGLDLAPGVYIYYVDSALAGTFTGKFAVIK